MSPMPFFERYEKQAVRFGLLDIVDEARHAVGTIKRFPIHIDVHSQLPLDFFYSCHILLLTSLGVKT